EVKREDLILGEALLDETREAQLHQLAAQRSRSHEVLGDERVPRDLHRDRAETLTHAEGADVPSTGSQKATPIETVVIVEPSILGREKRVAHVSRDLFDGNVDAPNHCQAADQ